MSEAKVWEEEWTSDGERVELCQDEKPYGSVVVGCIGSFHHRDNECLEVDRAHLAAAAPAMARLLLELYKEHGDRHTFDWAYWFTEIEEALTAAGVPVPKENGS